MFLTLGLDHTRVTDSNNDRVPGCYHHLSLEDAAKVRQSFASKCAEWGRQAAAAGMTCGSMVEVGGGQGSGRGSLFMCTIELGPFLGQ